MKDINLMTKADCIKAIARMFGFETYRGYFSEKDDVETLRNLVVAQQDKYLINKGE